MIIEIVVEVICITLYSIVFYRYYTKRRLTKSMDMRDRARSDLYLAQLRTMSAPNTPGFGPKSPGFGSGNGPKSPALSQYAMSPRLPPAAYRSMSDIKQQPQATNPFTPGGRVVEPHSQFDARPSPTTSFKLQAPPAKAPSATPKSAQGAFTPTSAVAQSPVDFTQVSHHHHHHHNPVQPHTAGDNDEPTYDAVPIPGAYADQAVKSPPAEQTSFGLSRDQ